MIRFHVHTGARVLLLLAIGVGGTTGACVRPAPVPPPVVTASPIATLALTVCARALQFAAATRGAFTPPTPGAPLDVAGVAAEQNASLLETVACQHLGPALRDYAGTTDPAGQAATRATIRLHLATLRPLVTLQARGATTTAATTALDQVRATLDQIDQALP